MTGIERIIKLKVTQSLPQPVPRVRLYFLCLLVETGWGVIGKPRHHLGSFC